MARLILFLSFLVFALASCQSNQQNFGFLKINCNGFNFESENLDENFAECKTWNPSGSLNQAKIEIQANYPDGLDATLRIWFDNDLNSLPLNTPISGQKISFYEGIGNSSYQSGWSSYNQNAIVTLTSKGDEIGEFVEGTITGYMDYNPGVGAGGTQYPIIQNIPVNNTFKCYITSI
jgi:hypothetical protein